LSLFEAEVQPSIAPAALPGYQRIFLGHETVGEVIEIGKEVRGLSVGDRVVMDTRFHGPTCLSQEIEPLCRNCKQGNYTLCENASICSAPSGIGGGWSDSFIAHEKELYAVPDALSDEQAMMIEPLSIGCRASLRRIVNSNEKVLIVGGGIVGLNTLQCLRAIYPQSNITISVRYNHQASIANRLGADQILQNVDLFEATARMTGAKLYKGLLNNYMPLGGFDVIYDCIGTAQSLEVSLRCARAKGTVILVGISLSSLKLDLTPVWFQEVDLIGVCGHGREALKGESRHTYTRVIDLLKQHKLTIDELITHRYPLHDWRQAISTAKNRKDGAIRVVFDMKNQSNSTTM
jgi:threonine dehydrogenase-like Zn-dependent dehydrogenase